MSDMQVLYPLPDATASAKAPRTVRFWGLPIVISLAVLAPLAAWYLGGTLKPTSSLRHFPVAIVNEDAGPTGEKVVKEVVANLDKDKFDVRVLSREEARQQLNTARVYGAALIPPDFSEKLRAFAQNILGAGKLERPVIAVSTNPRAGTLGANIASGALSKQISVFNARLGKELLATAVKRFEGKPLPSVLSLALASPIEVKTTAHNPLPDGTGNGLSAFYYSLLLLLAGFTGSIVVSMLVDSMLGYIPAEFGPVYRFAERVNISRFYTLVMKWALMAVLAVLTSAVYMAIATTLGMPIGHGWALWLYGVFAIAAVGVTSVSLIAALGSVGLLVSLLLFVILGLPSAGAGVPLEATPALFGWLGTFEPMHQVFLGTRALLYFDGQAKAGLSQAVALTAVGLSIGLLLGAVVTNIYDRRGYHRIPAPEAAGADEPETPDTPETEEYPDDGRGQDDERAQVTGSVAKHRGKSERENVIAPPSTLD